MENCLNELINNIREEMILKTKLTGYPTVIGISILNTIILASNFVVILTGCCMLQRMLPILHNEV